MSDLKIDSGLKRITTNGDPNRVIEFNPDDLLFAEKFYALVGEFERKEKQFNKEMSNLDKNESENEYGIPSNTGERLVVVRGIIQFFRDKIDDVFGEGTSDKAFGDVMSLDVIVQFFEGIAPFVQESRSAKTAKYVVKGKKKK